MCPRYTAPRRKQILHPTGKEAAVRDVVRPVSYTHLDVYKRQVLERFKRDEEEHEAVQEGEAVGQVVRKMQAVPEKVGEIDGTAEALSLIHI